MEDPRKTVENTIKTKGDSPPAEKLARRREFLLSGGKILAYSVPVIASFQAKPLSARQMTGSSPGGSAKTNNPEQWLKPPDEDPQDEDNHGGGHHGGGHHDGD